MRCKSVEKWISDSLDKDISERKKSHIEKHVTRCPSCRAFRENILLLEKEARTIAIAEVSHDYKQEFSLRLKSKILSLEEKEKKVALPFLKQRWVLVSSAFVLAAIMMSVFLLILPEKVQEMEFYAFSFGDAVEEIYREIGEDIELERAFNSQILASIDDLLNSSAWTEQQRTEEDFFLWEDLTDKDLEFLESAIKKETKL
ncbi:MAG: zf-HC2 domain-containing protein [Candidatus Aminicenantes bacterium]|jgi:hypothetical protein